MTDQEKVLVAALCIVLFVLAVRKVAEWIAKGDDDGE